MCICVVLWLRLNREFSCLQGHAKTVTNKEATAVVQTGSAAARHAHHMIQTPTAYHYRPVLICGREEEVISSVFLMCR